MFYRESTRIDTIFYFPYKEGLLPCLPLPRKKELAARERIGEKWPNFREFRAATYRHLLNGRSLSERDVEAVFESLLTGPLGYSPAQIDRQPDFADYVLLSRDLKLAVVEAKGWEAFRADGSLHGALTQAATYADRHRVKHLFAFDGEVIALAIREGNNIGVILELKVDGQEQTLVLTAACEIILRIIQ